MSKRMKMLLMLCCAVFVLGIAGLAFADTNNGTEFQALYTRVLGWVTGLPAIIISIGIAIVAVMRAFSSGNFVWALAGILVAALIFILPTILSGLGGATIDGTVPAIFSMLP